VKPKDGFVDDVGESNCREELGTTPLGAVTLFAWVIVMNFCLYPIG
jgi:F0F1-type ATP synthase membrane subunit a